MAYKREVSSCILLFYYCYNNNNNRNCYFNSVSEGNENRHKIVDSTIFKIHSNNFSPISAV